MLELHFPTKLNGNVTDEIFVTIVISLSIVSYRSCTNASTDGLDEHNAKGLDQMSTQSSSTAMLLFASTKERMGILY